MNNTLFYYLAALGVLALAALVVHNAWQARKAGPRRAVVDRSDAALREQREPTMDGGMAPDADTVAADVGMSSGAVGSVANEGLGGEPATVDGETLGDASSDATSPSEGATTTAGTTMTGGTGEPGAPVNPWLMPRRQTARLDGLIDAIATLTLEAPISGEMAIAHLPPSRRAGGKPFMIEGLNAESGLWEPCIAQQRYGELQAGVLLANRTGALNEIEYSEFVQKIQAFADALGAAVQFPDMLDVVAHARELDGFASQHDAQLVVHLQASVVAWSVGYIHQQASKHGFVTGAVPGRLVMLSPEEGAPAMLVLSYDPQAALAEDPNQAAVRDLTLSFDVPQTEAPANPFAAWQKAAQGLAADTQARVVDDNGNAIATEGFEMIGGELVGLYEALDGRGLAAGSMAARRLFS
jgi:hypothetical protein